MPDLPGIGFEGKSDLYKEMKALAARYPYPEHPLNGAWPAVRLRDGTVQRP